MGARKGEGEQEGTASEQTTGEPSRRHSRSRARSDYSGRILVRMPSELHAQLAEAAQREDMSLNRYVNDALSSSVDGSGPPAEAATAEADSRLSRGRAVRLALATNLAVVVLAGIAAVVLLVLAIQRGI